MTFADSVQTCFSKFATFAGRASRSEYWWFYLFAMIVDVIAEMAVGATQSTALSLAAALVTIAMVIPYMAVGARRLHDIGRTGWWQLLALTGIGAFVLLYWFVQPSEPATNAYGPPSA